MGLRVMNNLEQSTLRHFEQLLARAVLYITLFTLRCNTHGGSRLVEASLLMTEDTDGGQFLDREHRNDSRPETFDLSTDRCRGSFVHLFTGISMAYRHETHQDDYLRSVAMFETAIWRRRTEMKGMIQLFERWLAYTHR